MANEKEKRIRELKEKIKKSDPLEEIEIIEIVNLIKGEKSRTNAELKIEWKRIQNNICSENYRRRLKERAQQERIESGISSKPSKKQDKKEQLAEIERLKEKESAGFKLTGIEREYKKRLRNNRSSRERYQRLRTKYKPKQISNPTICIAKNESVLNKMSTKVTPNSLILTYVVNVLPDGTWSLIPKQLIESSVQSNDNNDVLQRTVEPIYSEDNSESLLVTSNDSQNDLNEINPMNNLVLEEVDWDTISFSSDIDELDEIPSQSTEIMTQPNNEENESEKFHEWLKMVLIEQAEKEFRENSDIFEW